MNKQTRIDSKPNRLLPGYLHVSVGGPYRSTLKYAGRKAGAHMSARQRRKTIKALRRFKKGAAEVAAALR